MTYYQELLIESNASIDEVHKSYKKMTRLLHPDLHSDPALRALADIQMKRLHEFVAVLSDPERRRLYDLSLDPVPQQRPQMPLHDPRRVALYCLFIGIITGSLIVFVGNKSEPICASQPVNVPLTSTVNTSDSGRLKSDTRPRAAGHFPTPSATADPDPPFSSLPPPEPRPAEPADAAERRLAPDPKTVSEPPPPECADCDNGSFAGAWLYAKRKGATDNSLYPPEYIEMRVTEHQGTLRGAYRARYHVPDRPIAPEVAFEFEGKAGGGEALLVWTGAGGTRGEVKLRTLSPNSMEVNWYVTNFGAEPGLGAGTAVLIRRVEQ